MTRASLLHILDHSTMLGADEVRELEQLAQAFPYCQTAHLLLAKAAHDQGAMLASQRLRRAATYAADRALLRQLIESVPEAPKFLEPATVHPEAPSIEPASTLAVAIPESIAPPAPPTVPVPATEPLPVTEAVAAVAVAPLPIVEPVVEAKAVAEPSPEPSPVIVPEIVAVVAPLPTVTEQINVEPIPIIASSQSPALVAEIIAESIKSSPTAPIVAAPVTVEAESTVPPATVPTMVSLVAGIVPLPEPQKAEVITAVEQVPEVAPEPTPVSLEKADNKAPDSEPQSVKEEAPSATTLAESQPALNQELAPAEDELPIAAPPVRPPVEEGSARFEFGLGEELPVAPAYLLPGLTDEWTWPLPKKPEPSPILTPASFQGDSQIGYGWGESSRLGLALLPLADKLEESVDGSGLTTVFGVTPLPPAGEFFPPDALLQAYWAEHSPVVSRAPSTFALIDNFLRQKPRLSRPNLHKATTEAIADLSNHNTRPDAELSSETLARIFARQGKTTRAIEIYERLMVKQPEKMAYFAAEIQQLQLQQPPSP